MDILDQFSMEEHNPIFGGEEDLLLERIDRALSLARTAECVTIRIDDYDEISKQVLSMRRDVLVMRKKYRDAILALHCCLAENDEAKKALTPTYCEPIPDPVDYIKSVSDARCKRT